jgi:bacterioferritin-associated ferredoxin
MLVCQCRGVSDRQIRRLVREGACSTRDVVRATGAGRDCGGCRSDVKKVVELAVEQVASRDLQRTTIQSQYDTGTNTLTRATRLLDETLSFTQTIAIPVES